jgi:hypothetical protein
MAVLLSGRNRVDDEADPVLRNMDAAVEADAPYSHRLVCDRGVPATRRRLASATPWAR